MLLSAVAAAGFPLFSFMWIYKVDVPPRANLPNTSVTEPASYVWENNKISFVWVNKWTTSASGEGKGISVKWKLVAP